MTVFGHSASRPTIGFVLNDSLSNIYVRMIWDGVMRGAEAEDVNLICFGGTHVEKGADFLRQNTTLLSQIVPDVVDGLVTVGLQHDVTLDQIPVVGARPVVSVQPSKFPSIVAENRQGMRSVLEHLIVTHGCRRIAFVRGSRGEQTGEQRYQVYLEVLRDHQIEHDPSLVFDGDFLLASGKAAVRAFFNERRVHVDAISTANDWMAFGVLEELEHRGSVVPREIAVVGFDDYEGAEFCEPPLTTVRQDLRAMGALAVKKVLSAIRGDTSTGHETVPADLIIRRSCGCVSESIVSAGVIPDAPTRQDSAEKVERLFAAERGRLCEVAESMVGAHAEGLGPQWAKELLDALAQDIRSESPIFLFGVLEKQLASLGRSDRRMMQANRAISALRSACLPVLSSNCETMARAESIWQQARVAINEADERQALRRAAAAEAKDNALQEVIGSFAGERTVAGITNALADELDAKLGVKVACLAVYEGTEHPIQWSRLLLAYRDGRKLRVREDEQRLPTRQIIPKGCRPESRRHTLLVIPLFVNFDENDQVGYAVFEVDRGNARLCEKLGSRLGAAIRAATMFEAVSEDAALRKQREEELEQRLRSFLAVVDAAAEGDLTQRGKEGDETLGRIAAAVNAMFSRFSVILADAHETARLVTESSTQILGAATEITQGAEKTSEQVLATSSSIGEIAASMSEVSKSAEASAQRARETLDHVQHSDQSVDAAYIAMTKIDAAVFQTSEKVKLLEIRTREIADIVEVIDRIARQSKMLALNAAITAAQAGEAGGGFSVVADEVRRLADSSSRAARDIAERIEGIVDDVEPVLTALDNATLEVREGRTLSDKARTGLNEISILVGDTSSMATLILTAAREQAEATRAVAEAIEAVSDITTRATSHAAGTSRAVKHLVSLAEKLSRSISRFRV